MFKSMSDNLVELSLDELSAVRGAQTTQRTAGDDLSDQAGDTLKAWGDFVEPVIAPVRETVKLVYAADRYLKSIYEHQYPTVSDSNAQRAEHAKAEHAKHAQDERDHALQSSKPSNAGDVAVWLDATNPNPGPPPDITVPFYMTDAPHEPEISIEPLDIGSENNTY